MKIKNNKLRNLKQKVVVILLLLLVFTVFFLYYCEHILRPVLTEYAQNKAQIYMENVINESVNDLMDRYSYSYSDIANITRDDSLKVSSIEINSNKINSLKSAVGNSIYAKLKSFDDFLIEIPIGTLTSSKYLLGRGPKVSFKMQLSAFTSTDFESIFYDAGINQTLHQIIINVNCKAYIIMPPYNTNCDVSTSFIAAQSVIVGTVPESYTSVFEGEPSDITDAIFDYADSVSYSNYN